jgi:hypothetical protein
MSHRLIHPDRRLLVVGPVRGIISGLDFREPFHADGVDLGDPVIEGYPVDLIFNLAIPENASRVTSCPFWSVLANFQKFLQAYDPLPRATA